MSKDFITNSILQSTADAIRYCDKTTNSIAPKDFADRIRELDKLIPQPDALNFYMPNGGTISLNTIGKPTVVELEYSLDRGSTWTVCQEDANGNRSIVLNAGQRMYVRNTSEISTYFSLAFNSYYKFELSSLTKADGDLRSLLCKNPKIARLSNSCFRYLFHNARYLYSPPLLLSTIIPASAYFQLFYGCINLKLIYTEMTDISADNCTTSWVHNIRQSGDFYCPAELTIPTGVSGMPMGWTRHDI